MTISDGQWEVSVRGPEGDMRYLAKHFASPPICIVASEVDQDYLLRMDGFGACADSSEVLAMAERQLTVLTGILKLERNPQGPLEAGAVFRRRNGGRDIFVHVREALQATFQVGDVEVTVTDAEGNVVPSPVVPARAVRIAELCMTEKAVEKVMRLRAAPDAGTWVGLYRIYEVVASDAGGEDVLTARSWSSGQEQRRFRHSANSITVAGDDARHGKELTDPPTHPMTLDEASGYVERLIRRWLDSKGV